jgi:ATP-dependent exoDNAse (exonuclease V) alpha subunit
MLRSNIYVPKGLVNGAIGFITKITWNYYRREQMYEDDIPKSITVNFEKDGIHEIHPLSIQFPAKFNYGTVERRMLPVILSWASTVHKMQGTTVEQAVIYLGRQLFKEGQAYVALSRVRSLSGLLIEELDCSKLTGKTPCNILALEEMVRMRNFKPTQ